MGRDAEESTMIFHLFTLQCLLILASGCPCNFNNETKEVSCDPGTQNLLPWSLPSCLSVEDDQVEKLNLANQEFHEIISYSFATFKSLKHLDLSFSKIALVDQFAFDENVHLKSLILSGNSIENLPALYRSSDNVLESLTVNHNKLRSMDSRNLNSLVYLDLDYNELTNANIPSILENLPNLYQLNLESNDITSVDKNMFLKQQRLERLSLWNNEISRISPGSFDHIVSLKYLNLNSNEELEEYRTEAWHFCHGLEAGILEVDLEHYQKVSKDLKTAQTSDSYCDKNTNDVGPSVAESCSNVDGHLNCEGNIENLVCELMRTNFSFTSISFNFPKDHFTTKLQDFKEAENNPYFKEINGNKTTAKYLSHLKLYGTKFDLAELDDYVGLRTKEVTIIADTIYMSRPLRTPINFILTMRARVVSISEDISMIMTRDQFINPLPADQLVDNWASVEEVVTGVGNSSYTIRKLGFIQVQRAQLNFQPKTRTSKSYCSPGVFDVQSYELEHNTSPDVFFDQVQLNLLRVAVRTLSSTRSNDLLAIEMADHALSITADPKIVTDRDTYMVAQKLIRDKEVLQSHYRNVPFFTLDVIKELSKTMADEMTLYHENEAMLMLKLDLALGTVAVMNQHFEEAKLMRQMYFEGEKAILEEIWASSQAMWDWDFSENRENEQNIQDNMNQNGDAMFQMQEDELKEMLARAKDTVIHDQAVVDKFRAEIERYSNETEMSLRLQQIKLNATNEAGEEVTAQQADLDSQIEKWKHRQEIKLAFSVATALAGLAVAIATMQPALAAGAVAGAVADAPEDIEKIQAIFESIEKLVEVLASIQDMYELITGMDVDVDIDIGGDLALNMTSSGWRLALENAYNLKEMSDKFSDIRIQGETIVDAIGPATDNYVDPSKMKQAMFTFCDRGTQLLQETINYAQLMMHLADLAGDLEVAESDLSRAVEEVERIEQNLLYLHVRHVKYTEDMNQNRDEYQNKIDDMAKEWNANFTAAKEKYREEIEQSFEKFESEFEESNEQYISLMNELTASLYDKAASVKQHSMVQRSLIMNLYQDYCDGIFYSWFQECHQEQSVPTMSDNFDDLILKLDNIQWDTMMSISTWPGNPVENFCDVVIDMMDLPASGFNSSSNTSGVATSLREDGEVSFNIKEHDDYLSRFYRVRVDMLQVKLLDKNGVLYQSPEKEYIQFTVKFPMDFIDRDPSFQKYSFHGQEHTCTSSYYFLEGEFHSVSKCAIAKEFEGKNHKTSQDGQFKIIAKEISQEILDDIGGIRVATWGTYVTDDDTMVLNTCP